VVDSAEEDGEDVGKVRERLVVEVNELNDVYAGGTITELFW
jgi:hypothetical protein